MLRNSRLVSVTTINKDTRYNMNLLSEFDFGFVTKLFNKRLHFYHNLEDLKCFYQLVLLDTVHHPDL